MTNNRFLPVRFFVSFTIIILFVLTWFSFSCKNKITEVPSSNVPPGHQIPSTGLDSMGRWVTWNILFKSGTDSQARDAGILSVEASIVSYLRTRYEKRDSARFYLFYCPCDSLLFNLGATPIDGVGQSIIPAPPPPPAPGGSGDMLYVSNNNSLEREDSVGYAVEITKDTTKRVPIISPNTKSQQTLAIIDTGLDTTLFLPSIRNLLWQPSSGSGSPLYNFVGGNLQDFRDNHLHKHGTVVTALALHALGRSGNRPRLMILKALDSLKQGTTFTVSCALSYAIKNNASVINASLGYYENNNKVDSVFRHYVGLCNSASIAIFAAAGNAPGSHNGTILCSSASKDRELSDSQLFYPACFSTTMENVVSVTGLAAKGACYYQNFSSTYVSLGVLNDAPNPNCCSYYIPFLSPGCEGSSFATPIACGKMVACFLNGSGTTILKCIGTNTKEDSRWKQITKNGRMLLYSDYRPW